MVLIYILHILSGFLDNEIVTISSYNKANLMVFNTNDSILKGKYTEPQDDKDKYTFKITRINDNEKTINIKLASNGNKIGPNDNSHNIVVYNRSKQEPKVKNGEWAIKNVKDKYKLAIKGKCLTFGKKESNTNFYELYLKNCKESDKAQLFKIKRLDKEEFKDQNSNSKTGHKKSINIHVYSGRKKPRILKKVFLTSIHNLENSSSASYENEYYIKKAPKVHEPKYFDYSVIDESSEDRTYIKAPRKRIKRKNKKIVYSKLNNINHHFRKPTTYEALPSFEGIPHSTEDMDSEYIEEIEHSNHFESDSHHHDSYEVVSPHHSKHIKVSKI